MTAPQVVAVVLVLACQAKGIVKQKPPPAAAEATVAPIRYPTAAVEMKRGEPSKAKEQRLFRPLAPFPVLSSVEATLRKLNLPVVLAQLLHSMMNDSSSKEEAEQQLQQMKKMEQKQPPERRPLKKASNDQALRLWQWHTQLQ